MNFVCIVYLVTILHLKNPAHIFKLFDFANSFIFIIFIDVTIVFEGPIITQKLRYLYSSRQVQVTEFSLVYIIEQTIDLCVPY